MAEEINPAMVPDNDLVEVLVELKHGRRRFIQCVVSQRDASGKYLFGSVTHEQLQGKNDRFEFKFVPGASYLDHEAVGAKVEEILKERVKQTTTFSEIKIPPTYDEVDKSFDWYPPPTN